MTVYLIAHIFKNSQYLREYIDYREKRIDLIQKHGGSIISIFQPEGHERASIPDEIHIIEFPSGEDYEIFQKDPAHSQLSELKERAVLNAIEYRSGLIIPSESVLQTVLTRRPAELSSSSETTQFLTEQLTGIFPRPKPDEFHPVQKQAELDTAILHPQNQTQKSLSRLVQQWQTTNDRRAIFAHTYYLMTTNMLNALESGEFHDREWVADLLDKFAGYYFSALDEYERIPTATPPVWKVAFQVAENANSFTVQHLLLGVNAHINYDLTKTLIDVLKDEWKTAGPELKQSRYEDHTDVNRIIEKTLDETQELVIARYSPVLDKLNQVSFNLDDLVISSLIRSWREQAWQHAVGFLDAEDWNRQHSVLQETEYIALRRADMIMLRQGPIRMKVLY